MSGTLSTVLINEKGLLVNPKTSLKSLRIRMRGLSNVISSSQRNLKYSRSSGSMLIIRKALDKSAVRGNPNERNPINSSHQ